MSLIWFVLITAGAVLATAWFLDRVNWSLEAKFLFTAVVAASVMWLMTNWVGALIVLIPVAGGYIEARYRGREA